MAQDGHSSREQFPCSSTSYGPVVPYCNSKPSMFNTKHNMQQCRSSKKHPFKSQNRQKYHTTCKEDNVVSRFLKIVGGRKALPLLCPNGRVETSAKNSLIPCGVLGDTILAPNHRALDESSERVFLNPNSHRGPNWAHFVCQTLWGEFFSSPLHCNSVLISISMIS